MERIDIPFPVLRVRFNQTPAEMRNEKHLRNRSITKAARGRTCGDCAHFRGWWCDERKSLADNALEVAASSVACSSFTKG